jgi:hypothetical protein
MQADFVKRPIGIYLHIFFSVVATLLGPFQVISPMRDWIAKRQWFKDSFTIHRTIGVIYTCSVTVGGIAGIYMGYHAKSHCYTVCQVGFMTLGLCWLITLALAIACIAALRAPLLLSIVRLTSKAENIYEASLFAHQRWMVRNYALTFAAVTLRGWLGLFMGLLGPNKFDDFYPSLAWLAWVPNTIVGEILLRVYVQPESKTELQPLIPNQVA